MNTAVVSELSPKTDYSLTLYAVYSSLIGDSATITVQTSGCHTLLHAHAQILLPICFPFHCTLLTWATMFCLVAPLPQVSNFRVIEEGLYSLRLGWTPSLGKLNGFKIFIPRCMLAIHNAIIIILQPTHCKYEVYKCLFYRQVYTSQFLQAFVYISVSNRHVLSLILLDVLFCSRPTRICIWEPASWRQIFSCDWQPGGR